jgi:hypothetical protein
MKILVRAHALLLPVVMAAFLPIQPAAAVELPTRKPGLWEMTLLREGTAVGLPAMQHCTDAEIDKEMTTMVGNIQEQCSKKDIQKVGDAYIIDSVCTFGGATSTAHTEITGDFNSAYTVKVKTSVEGGRMPGASTLTIQAKWMSACRSDQRPGDIIMPGVKFNVQDMLNLRKLLPKQ